MGYLANFIVYTLAMVGVIVIALMVFKNSTGISIKNSSKFLKVKDSLSLGPRKTLYIISAGNEEFLLAGDVDRTNLISKLNSCSNESGEVNTSIDFLFKETIEKLPQKSSYMDKSGNGTYKKLEKPYNSVMKNLVHNIKN